MKPKIDPTKPVRTRDGREVTILTTTAPIIRDGRPFPIVALVPSRAEHRNLDLRSFTAEGSLNGHGESISDLVNVMPPRRAKVQIDPNEKIYGYAFGEHELTDLPHLVDFIELTPEVRTKLGITTP